MTNKNLTEKEFSSFVDELFEYRDRVIYFDFTQSEYSFVEKKYFEKFGTKEFVFCDETLKELNLTEKWSEICKDLYQKEFKNGKNKIYRKIGDFACSARVLGFSLDFDLPEFLDKKTDEMASWLLS